MKILIVDDEPAQASSLAQWLESNGWGAPGIAGTAEDAVNWINQNGGIDVLVCNVYMQPVDGFTLRETVQPHFPAMRTVFLTAYDVSGYADRIGSAAVLTKPATGEALDAAIRKLFEPPKAATPAPAVVATATPVAKAATPVQAKPVAAVARAAAPVAAAAPKPAVAAAPQAAVAATSPKPAVASAPKAAAAPKAAVAAKPAAVAAVAKAPVAAARGPVPAGEMELAADEFVGQTIGNYKIEVKIGVGGSGGIYRATQTNIGRQVRFYILDPGHAQDAEAVQNFIANASVKANVAHPYILAVYEAGQAGGVYFYSCEYIPCRSVRQIVDSGSLLSEAVAVQAMKIAAETLNYFDQSNIAHNLISENSLLIGSNNKPRLANIAAFRPPEAVDRARQMAELGRVISVALPPNSQALGIRKFASDLARGAIQFATWPELLEAITAMEPKVAPEDAYKLDAQERAAIRMVEEARKRQRRSMIVSSVVSLSLLAVALGVVYFLVFSGRAKEFNTMIEIPAGEFIYQDNQKVNLPKFYIDEYEVTIAQYAEFLEYLKNHPEEEAKFAHPDQVKNKDHTPVGWATDADNPGYYERGKRWGKYQAAPLDVNHPVFGVDWFDAYAYAKWKGRRLPTEQEWEKAARGTGGFLYPWGNEPDPKKANTGADYIVDPKRGGEIDGWDRSSPVDAMSKDSSQFRVKDMAGNVSEWTATFVDDPMMKGLKVPVARGGNWRRPNDYTVTRRVISVPAISADEALGFRTASDTAPAAK